MGVVAAADLIEQKAWVDQRRYEAHQRWEQAEMADPRFATTRMMVEDIRHHRRVLPETWDRVDVEERTWAAEVLNAPHSHIDRFRFDGQDIIVKESDGVNPAVTLREVYQKGLDKTRVDVVQEPGLAFQLRRDELFMEFYEQVVRLMRGELGCDTIHMRSTCPIPEELPVDLEEAMRLLTSRFYNLEQRKSFDYTARRLPDGRLELSATRLDSSDLGAHAKVLQASGYANVSFALLTSHEYGRFLSYENTTDRPIETVVSQRAALYDAELTAKTGKPHRFGRIDDRPDAHQFFRDHTEDYWAGYKAFNELLAQHLAGGELHRSLQKYLLKCLDSQEQVGSSVLAQDKFDRLRQQLWHGKITADMAMSCRELLIYDHHATLTRLYKQFCEAGRVDQLDYTGSGDFMDAYADTVSTNGTEAAANGETFAGCETATGVNSLSSAQESLSSTAQLAAAAGVSLEQALRMQEEEALHCLRIQLYGYTIRKGVQCPFCEQTVDAKDTVRTIECLSDDCGTVLNKATGQTSTRPSLAASSAEQGAVAEKPTPVKPRNGQSYQVGSVVYRRQLLTVVGGAKLAYVDPRGQYIQGPAAERLEAIISAQLSGESLAA